MIEGWRRMKNRTVKRFSAFGLFTDGVFRTASLRITVPVGLTFIMFVLGVFLFFIPFMEEQLMGQKRRMIQDLTDNAWSLPVQYEAEVRNGDLSLKQAQKRAMNRIRKLRYGPEGKDYFWINDNAAEDGDAPLPNGSGRPGFVQLHGFQWYATFCGIRLRQFQSRNRIISKAASRSCQFSVVRTGRFGKQKKSRPCPQNLSNP